MYVNSIENNNCWCHLVFCCSPYCVLVIVVLVSARASFAYLLLLAWNPEMHSYPRHLQPDVMICAKSVMLRSRHEGNPWLRDKDLFCKASENTLRTCCTLSKNACPCREQSCVYFFTFSDVMLYLCLVLQAAGLVGAQLELRAVCNGARCQQGYVHQKCGGQRAQQQQVRVHEACRVSVII